MSITFNAFEIFEMAEQIERNGVKFYRKAAEIFTDRDISQTLLEFADMESPPRYINIETNALVPTTADAHLLDLIQYHHG